MPRRVRVWAEPKAKRFFPNSAPYPFQSLIRMIGGRLSGNEAECTSINEPVMQRGTRIYLWPKFSEYPVARHFVYRERSIWDAISKILLACTVATPGRVGFARGGKLLPFPFYRLNREPSEFPQPTSPSDWPFDGKPSRSVSWSTTERRTKSRTRDGMRIEYGAP